MKVGKLYLLLSSLTALAVGPGCQSAQRPIALLPPSQAKAPTVSPATAPKTQTSIQTTSSEAPQTTILPRTEAVAELLAKVEPEYQSGLANFKAGKLEAAKLNFSRAIDLLTNSSFEVNWDERLQQELELLDSAMKDVEQQDQEQADAAVQQEAAPAPIDEANEATPPVDPNVKAKAEAEIKTTHSDLPLMMTDQVAGFINYFSGRGQGVLERGLIRSGRYQEMIQRILAEEGVPQDLIYLAQAESGFHPLALSRAGARGMWQFMAGRGAGYGLQRSKWVDERQDPEKATRAAARHLKDLYHQFGDWYLAMAAYNSGPGRVQSAVKRTGYADFWELYKRNVLPKETRNYVPIIVAVTIMAKNPAQYGLEKLVPEKPVAYETVHIDYPVDIRLVAQCIDAPPADLLDLNPSLLRWTTPENAEFELRLPAGKKQQYLEAIEAIPGDMRVWWRYHKVAPGDTLASIAQSYRTTTQSILQVNKIDPDAELLADTRLVVPIAAGKHAASEDGLTYSRLITRHKVRRGDTVASVADRYSVPVSMVRRWNGLRGNSLGGRRVVFIHQPVSPNTANTWVAKGKASPKKKLATSRQSLIRHKVKPGETLVSIASTHHTTVSALKRDNHGLVLRPGMVLVIRAQ